MKCSQGRGEQVLYKYCLLSLSESQSLSSTLSVGCHSEEQVNLSASLLQGLWNPGSQKPSQVTPRRATADLVRVIRTPPVSHPHKQHWLSPGAKGTSSQLPKASILLHPTFLLCPGQLVCLRDQREFSNLSIEPYPAHRCFARVQEEDHEEGRDAGGVGGR